MRAIHFAGAILGAVLISASAPHHRADPKRFEARLTGASEIPPIVTQADGKAEFTISGDTVTYAIQVNHLTDVTGAHIHVAARAATGPVAVSLFDGPKQTVQAGELVHGTFTPADVHGITFQTLIDDMNKGAAYVNVHTAAHPKGEIRGQINPSGMETSTR